MLGEEWGGGELSPERDSERMGSCRGEVWRGVRTFKGKELGRAWILLELRPGGRRLSLGRRRLRWAADSW